MPHYELPWQTAAVLAALVAAAWLVARLRLPHRPVVPAALRECAVVLGLFALWQLAGQLALVNADGAYAHARWLWHAERVLHLPSELQVQAAVLPHPLLVQAMNGYYVYGHLNGMILFLAWMFLRHREHYPRARNVVALSTGACLLVALLPVAPPRLLPGLGFVDTAMKYGQSVYGAFGPGLADQLSAFPSVHVGWAVLVGAFVVLESRSRWRWLALLHPALTVLVVVATGNHFWLDGVASVALLALAAATQAAWERVTGSAAPPLGTPERPAAPARSW